MSKLADGIKKYRGQSVEIPGVSRDDIPGFIKERGGKVMVEVGVYRGEYGEVLAKSGLEIYGVDPWLAYPDYPYYGQVETQEREDANYKETVRRLAPYQNVQLLRTTSMQALQYFPDESIDCVYIDANHDFKYVAEDIAGWTKKVKKGGFVSGHDYIYANPENFHVRYVVDAWVISHAIPNLWILGRKKADKGEIRDKFRSWMFQRQ